MGWSDRKRWWKNDRRGIVIDGKISRISADIRRISHRLERKCHWKKNWNSSKVKMRGYLVERVNGFLWLSVFRSTGDMCCQSPRRESLESPYFSKLYTLFNRSPHFLILDDSEKIKIPKNGEIISNLNGYNVSIWRRERNDYFTRLWTAVFHPRKKHQQLRSSRFRLKRKKWFRLRLLKSTADTHTHTHAPVSFQSDAHWSTLGKITTGRFASM